MRLSLPNTQLSIVGASQRSAGFHCQISQKNDFIFIYRKPRLLHGCYPHTFSLVSQARQLLLLCVKIFFNIPSLWLIG